MTRAFALAVLFGGCASVEPPCDTDTVRCNGLCTDLSTDVSNCGECGLSCTQGERCVDLECVAGCSAGLEMCGIECVDFDSDPGHCGSCTNACMKNVFPPSAARGGRPRLNVNRPSPPSAGEPVGNPLKSTTSRGPRSRQMVPTFGRKRGPGPTSAASANGRFGAPVTSIVRRRPGAGGSDDVMASVALP